jgi:hypothetical protein
MLFSPCIKVQSTIKDNRYSYRKTISPWVNKITYTNVTITIQGKWALAAIQVLSPIKIEKEKYINFTPVRLVPIAHLDL